jgi:predicted glycogen debranching enzyme
MGPRVSMVVENRRGLERAGGLKPTAGAIIQPGVPYIIDDQHEWLETDGLGGFASGTTSLVRTRRYHALLLTATTPPTGRILLVNGCEAWVTTAAGRVALTTERYQGGVEYPDGSARLTRFDLEPWPTWTWALADGTQIVHEIFVPHGQPTVILAWRVASTAQTDVRLDVRLFMSGRDYHATHHENGAFRFMPSARDGQLEWHAYDGVPSVHVRSTGGFQEQPDWYRRFFYTAEAARGLDASEDLASPGVFSFSLSPGEALMALSSAPLDGSRSVSELVQALRQNERARRAQFASPLERATDAYVVSRGTGRTIIAGYPWFTDWGRDTFIAMRGLTLATGRLEQAHRILVEWAGAVSEGMLPNRFPDQGAAPEYNAVDASLWYVIVVDEFLTAAEAAGHAVSADDRARLTAAVLAIVDGYARGTRYGIGMDADSLLASGVAGVQLTWMDAKVGDRVITPRIGKPVEVQALWINALIVAGKWDARWGSVVAAARDQFERRFWNADRECLFDVIDVDHVAGRVDAALRPNQLLAVGGLPVRLVGGDRGRKLLAVVERELLTPLGPRSLGPGEVGYCAQCSGSVAERDAAYHQGTVWPWLMGAYVDAVLATAADTTVARAKLATATAPLLTHLADAGLGHVSEIADAESPFTPRGCPFQAWSLGELIRIQRFLAPSTASLPLVHAASDGVGGRRTRRKPV